MTACDRGNVLLVGFVFSDASGRKLRLVLVVSSAAYHRARQEVVVAAITSNVKRRVFGDHLIADWKEAGLLFPSVVTGIVRTIKRTMVDRKLGSVSKSDLESVNRQLRRSLGL